jgi:hypothetical protein
MIATKNNRLLIITNPVQPFEKNPNPTFEKTPDPTFEKIPDPIPFITLSSETTADADANP